MPGIAFLPYTRSRVRLQLMRRAGGRGGEEITKAEKVRTRETKRRKIVFSVVSLSLDGPIGNRQFVGRFSRFASKL